MVKPETPTFKPHELGHPGLAALNTSLSQITKDPRAAIDVHTLIAELFNLRCQRLALHGPW
jgi:hypothetical protein